jgi:predicted hydrocarbon binding protein
MHGIILAELKSFVDATFGEGVWRQLLAASQLGSQSYDAGHHYSDDHVRKIVASASDRTGLPIQTILEDFGEFIAPQLLAMYPSLISPEWKTLEVIEHTEETIHTLVRSQYANAIPPYLRVHRTGPEEIVVFYDSPRKLCFIAKGIIKGLAKHFDETIRVMEQRCMLTGAPDCTLLLAREN